MCACIHAVCVNKCCVCAYMMCVCIYAYMCNDTPCDWEEPLSERANPNELILNCEGCEAYNCAGKAAGMSAVAAPGAVGIVCFDHVRLDFDLLATADLWW